MVIITKAERDYLLSKGAKHRVDVFQTHSDSPTYYVKEADWLIKLLKEYRDGNKVQ